MACRNPSRKPTLTFAPPTHEEDIDNEDEEEATGSECNEFLTQRKRAGRCTRTMESLGNESTKDNLQGFQTCWTTEGSESDVSELRGSSAFPSRAGTRSTFARSLFQGALSACPSGEDRTDSSNDHSEMMGSFFEGTQGGFLACMQKDSAWWSEEEEVDKQAGKGTWDFVQENVKSAEAAGVHHVLDECRAGFLTTGESDLALVFDQLMDSEIQPSKRSRAKSIPYLRHVFTCDSSSPDSSSNILEQSFPQTRLTTRAMSLNCESPQRSMHVRGAIDEESVGQASTESDEASAPEQRKIIPGRATLHGTLFCLHRDS